MYAEIVCEDVKCAEMDTDSETDFFSHLRHVFDLCDQNQRGYLDSLQLRELGLKHLGGREEDMVQLLQCLDPDGLGSISYPDFCKGVMNLMSLQGAIQNIEGSPDQVDAFQNTATLSSPGSISDNLIDSPISSNNSSLINVDNGPPSIMNDVVNGSRRSNNNEPSGGNNNGRDRQNSLQLLNGVKDQLNSSKNLISPGYNLSDSEERFECYGEGDDLDEVDDGVDLRDGRSCPPTPIHHPAQQQNQSLHNHSDQLLNGFGAKPSLSSDSFRSTSSVGSTGSVGRNSSSARTTPFQHRNTWARSSLRRQSGSSKRLSSNALASQLFRNGSSTPNGHHSLNNNNNGGSSSRRSSLSCDSDEMYTDQISLEDDVIDLNQKVLELQHQVSTLSENQCNNDDRYSKVKQENQALMARIHSLEEQIRELEIRSEERVQEEERRLKDSMARHEREKNQELEHFTSRLYTLQQEHLEVKEELLRIKSQAERLRIEKIQIENELSECKAELNALQNEHQKFQELARREREEFSQERTTNARLLNELSRELDELRRFRRDAEEAAALATARSRSPSGLVDLPSRCQELEREARQLREECSALREANEELQAQLLNTSLAEGRQLLNPSSGKSLAQEFENLTKDQAVDALREQQDDNAKLRAYIDNILLNIVENYPQLLEVKAAE